MFNFNLIAAHEDMSIGELMSESLFPEDVDFFGIGVSPSFYSALIVTAVLLLFAVIVRIFVIPRFKKIPGKFQLLLETLVKFFDNLAKSNSPEYNTFLGAYIFSAGMYIFMGTVIEMFGFRAALGDLSSCLVMGIMSFSVILSGGFMHNKVKGGLGALKDFSLPISMTFRLFGAIIGGVLINELVYVGFSFLSKTVILPIFVNIMFTLMHAVVQTYVLTLLTSMFYGEAAEPKPAKKKEKHKKQSNTVTADAVTNE